MACFLSGFGLVRKFFTLSENAAVYGARMEEEIHPSRVFLRYSALLALMLFSVSAYAAQQTRAPTMWWLANIGNSGPGPQGRTLDPGGNCESCLQASGGFHWTGVLTPWTTSTLGCQFIQRDGSVQNGGCIVGAAGFCSEGFSLVGSLCVAIGGDIDPDKNNGPPPGCGIGNPCNPANGNKFERELDYTGSGPFPLRWVRTYNSIRVLKPGSMGLRWLANYDSYVSVSTGSGIATAIIARPDGKSYAFTVNNGVGIPDADVVDQLAQLVDGSGNFIGWKYTVYRTDEAWTYDATGRLTSITNRSGLTHVLGYDNHNLLTSISDSFGQQLTLG